MQVTTEGASEGRCRIPDRCKIQYNSPESSILMEDHFTDSVPGVSPHGLDAVMVLRTNVVTTFEVPPPVSNEKASILLLEWTPFN
jgi:hypothetical protein